MLKQRGGEGAIAVVAVERNRPSLRGEGDQRIRDRWLDLGKAAPDRARCDRPLHGLGEGIIAAGVQHHQTQALCRLDGL